MRGQQPLPLFDAELADRAKELGIHRAGSSDRAWPWKLHALEVIEELAASGHEFTADDVVAVTGLPSFGTNHNNAVGAIFNAAARRGLIVKVGYRKSKRTVSHSRVLTVWCGNPELDLDPP